MTPFLSVLIPCRDEARFLARCLDSILANDYPPERMEVLVIDGASTDGTRALIAGYQAAASGRKDSRVRLINNPQRITPCALNHGIEAARGEIIARVDAHAAVAPDYFRRSVDLLLSSGAENVGGVMRTLPQDPGCFAGPIVAALSHRFGVGNSYFRVGADQPRWVDTVFGGCWRREVFERVGRFNPRLRRSQDMEFSLRLKALGGRTLLSPEITCDYYARTRMGPFWRHNFANGEWAVLPFLYSPVMPVRPRHLLPLLFTVALAWGVVFAPWGGWPLGAVALPYALLSLGASLQIARRERSMACFFLMPLVFFSLHLSYGLGSLWGLLKVAAAPRPRDGAPSEEAPCIPRP
jgi:cellulose synthase/poly-beta-1,6-N-acetylglucosamine synthase-like glycosyltransferase